MDAADREAFDALAADPSGRALRFCYLLTHDWQMAEDLLQEGLVVTWRHWRRVDDPPAYLRRVVCHTHARWWRRRWRMEIPADRLPEQPWSDSTDGVDERERLHQALMTLTARQRVVLVLRFYADLSERQVADELNCPVGTVKSLTSRGLTQLRHLDLLTDTQQPTTRGTT